MACPHCGTNNPPIIDKEWLYRCPKCSRGKVRPLPVEMPITPKLKASFGLDATVEAVCTKCNKPYKRLVSNTSPLAHLCLKCRRGTWSREIKATHRKNLKLAASSDERAAGVVLKQNQFNARQGGMKQL